MAYQNEGEVKLNLVAIPLWIIGILLIWNVIGASSATINAITGIAVLGVMGSVELAITFKGRISPGALKASILVVAVGLVVGLVSLIHALVVIL